MTIMLIIVHVNYLSIYRSLIFTKYFWRSLSSDSYNSLIFWKIIDYVLINLTEFKVALKRKKIHCIQRSHREKIPPMSHRLCRGNESLCRSRWWRFCPCECLRERDDAACSHSRSSRAHEIGVVSPRESRNAAGVPNIFQAT